MPLPAFLFWLIFIWVLGPATWPLSRRLWRDTLPDAGYAVGRVLALCGWALLAFWLGHAHVPTRTSALLIFPLLLLGLGFAWRERAVLKAEWSTRRRAIVCGEFLFFAVFGFFLILRGFWPDAADGEKPMDMALIAACARAEYLPPPNAYAAGERLTAYYYFGHLQTALLTNALQTEPRWSYNLMCATLPALVFSSLFPLCAALSRSLKLGLVAACGVLGLGTLAPLREVWPQVFGEPLASRLYFATSRVIPYTINEYPFFTFCFGDLHGHFFAMPLAVLLLCCAWALWRKRRLGTVICSGFAIGALAVTNTWNVPLGILLIVLAIGCGRANRQRKIGAALLLMATALVAAAPFLLQMSSATKLHFIWPSSPPGAWLLLWGVFFAALFFGWVFHSGELTAETRFSCLLIFCGVLALLWCELAWTGFLDPPHHRQDTVFKFGLQAWVFLGVAAWCLVLRQIADGRWPRVLPFLFLPFLGVMFASSLMTFWSRARDFQQWRGWDAWSHLSSSPRAGAQWLQTHARAQDHMIEAEQHEGGDYSEYSRYVHATGIPIVAGPQAHTFQWLGGNPDRDWERVYMRKNDVREFYTTRDQAARLAILRKYRVRWIVCGQLEREEYGAPFVARVEKAFPVAARFGKSNDANGVVICENAPARTREPNAPTPRTSP